MVGPRSVTAQTAHNTSVPRRYSAARLRGRLELEASMRIGGVRLLALVLLFLALLNTKLIVTSNKALFEVNSFVEQAFWPDCVVCSALCWSLINI